MKNKKAKQKENKEWSVKYPKCPYFIYPNKYDELFWVIPVCAIMFFIKGGGWVYSIIALIAWFFFARMWTKRLWQQECRQKGKIIVLHNGEPLPEPEHDFHDDSQFHKHDELHFLYDIKTKKWESRQEVKDRTIKKEYTDLEIRMHSKELDETVFRKLEECWEDKIKNGR